jgi:hypothetical protein
MAQNKGQMDRGAKLLVTFGHLLAQVWKSVFYFILAKTVVTLLYLGSLLSKIRVPGTQSLNTQTVDLIIKIASK